LQKARTARSKANPSATPQRRETSQAEEDRGIPQVGLVLRRAREHRALSLRDVERRIGRSNAYLSQVERGLIRQPDPVVLLELANLYELDFTTLAGWAGFVVSTQGLGPSEFNKQSLRDLLRQILQLNNSQRAQVLAYVAELLREEET